MGRFFDGLTLALLSVLAFPAHAQSPGGAVPPLAEEVVSPPPVRDGEVLVQRQQFGQDGDNSADNRADNRALGGDIIARFRAAYESHNRPRLALYWNRQLGDTLSEWYGTDRTLMTGTGGAGGQGSPENPGGWTSSGNQQWVIEQQMRDPRQRNAPGQGRVQPSETWEWEFQDGLLAPLLEANVIVLDRAAVTHLTAASQPPGNSGPGGISGEQILESRALRNMADLLVEVLVAPSERSTTGYELHGRILDVQTGRIVANINSRHMEGWGQANDYLASERGFVKREDLDEEVIGPQEDETKFRASGDGFTKSRKPPQLRKISENLSFNIMNSLLTAWSR